MVLSKINDLDKSANCYDSEIISEWKNLYKKKRKKLFEAFQAYFRGKVALEMGIADGEMTFLIAENFPSVTIVDGSKIHVDQMRQLVKDFGLFHVQSIHSLFEEYEPAQCFNAIFMTHILEHLEDPVSVLQNAKQWLEPDGRIFIAVPNSNSLHRHIGVKLGLLEKIDSLNEQDRLLGHLRVYDPVLFKEHILEAGLSIIKFGGLMVKPLSNRQIETQWPDELIDAFFDISTNFPEICSEIYIIAEA